MYMETADDFCHGCLRLGSTIANDRPPWKQISHEEGSGMYARIGSLVGGWDGFRYAVPVTQEVALVSSAGFVFEPAAIAGRRYAGSSRGVVREVPHVVYLSPWLGFWECVPCP